MINVIKKNNATGSYELFKLEEGLFILKSLNNQKDNHIIEKKINKDFIQFHFCTKGNLEFLFNQGKYQIGLKEERNLLLYNPQQDLPLHLVIKPNSWWVSLIVSIKKLHELFSDEANYIDFLSDEKRNTKYYKEHDVSPSMAVVLSQVLNFNLHPSVKKLYLKAKAFELLSLYFNMPAETNIEQCPFLADEENVRKISQAKEIIINQMAEPPSLQELADEIDLSLKKLKEGFKEVYGDTVYGFLLDYKMEYARKLLESGDYNVNEVGLQVGYSTSSHFIAAFKKKFNTTPKKYIQSINLFS